MDVLVIVNIKCIIYFDNDGQISSDIVVLEIIVDERTCHVRLSRQMLSSQTITCMQDLTVLTRTYLSLCLISF